MLQSTLASGATDSRPSPRAPIRTSILVVGGGGPLGSEVLTQLLASTNFSTVQVLTTCELRSAVRGLQALVLPLLDTALAARAALIIFEDHRRVNGRNNAFAQPQPDALPALARWLRHQGVRHLIVMQPHDTALLPSALRVGLANLDEQAVTSMAFEHVVFVRPRQAPRRVVSGRWLQRLADGMLSQLRTIMLARVNRPVCPRETAALVAELAARLPGTPAGTQVLGGDLSLRTWRHHL